MRRATLIRTYLQHAHDDAFLFDHLYYRFQSLADKWPALKRQADRAGGWWPMTDVELDMLPTVETLLSIYARVSLLFFPDRSSGPAAVARAATLRRAINISATHALKNRTLRNHWMHLDHRLDVFIRNHNDVPIFFRIDRTADIEPEHLAMTLRTIDPPAETVYFLGERFDLPVLRGHIQDIYARADRCLLGEPPLP